MTDHRPIRSAPSVASGNREETDPALVTVVGAVNFEGDDDLLWQRIQRSRLSGERVPLPVDDGRPRRLEREIPRRRLRRWARWLLALLVLVLEAVLAVVVWRPERLPLRRWVRWLLALLVLVVMAVLAVVVWRPERLPLPRKQPATAPAVPPPASSTSAPASPRGADPPAR